jgi:hypothetical protein
MKKSRERQDMPLSEEKILSPDIQTASSYLSARWPEEKYGISLPGGLVVGCRAKRRRMFWMRAR